MKFSIITINYNNRDGLQKTINSVVSQTFKDYEWIIIDGGSTDGSRELIEQYQDSLAFWCSEPDKGVYNAMNKGIDHAKGEYLNFMNSGDTYENESTLQMVFKENITADIAYGNWLRIYPDHEKYMKAPENISLSSIYKENICHQAMFIKREIHKKEKYDERYKIYGDWALWQKMALEGKSFQYLPYTICRFEAGAGLSDTHTKEKKIEEKWIHGIYPSNILLLLQENKDLKNELHAIGPKIRNILSIRKNHPVYNKVLKICLLPVLLIAHLLYKREIISLNQEQKQ